MTRDRMRKLLEPLGMVMGSRVIYRDSKRVGIEYTIRRPAPDFPLGVVAFRGTKAECEQWIKSRKQIPVEIDF